MRLAISVLLLILPFFVYSKLPEDEQRVSSIVISGGLSLGNYEAGLNYVIVDSLKSSSSPLSPNLSSTAGASAGAINTIATAISHCNEHYPQSVTNNFFRDIWIDIGIERLLGSSDPLPYIKSPPQEQTKQLTIDREKRTYDYNSLELAGLGQSMPNIKMVIEDYAMSRGAFVPVIEKLRDALNRTDFKPGCRVDIGMMITKAAPEILEEKFSENNKLETRKQSYAVIFKFETIPVDELNPKKGYKGFFKNISSSKSEKNINRNFLKLPEYNIKEIDNSIKLAAENEGEMVIEFDSIARVALASSAFPIAFKKTALAVCQFKKKEDNKLSKTCPDNYEFKVDHYIDGGYFHNIPLGVAVELNALRYGWSLQPSIINNSEVKNGQEYLIFLDPDKLRNRTSNKSGKEKSGIDQQVNDILPGITTLRKAALYDDFKKYLSAEKAESEYRFMLQTDRNPYLTGNLLMNFGAFTEKLYREHDYAAGIYDGLLFLANHACINADADEDEDNIEKCRALNFKDNFQHIFSTIPEEINEKALFQDLKGIVGWFAFDEYVDAKENTTSEEVQKPWSEILSKLEVDTVKGGGDLNYIAKALKPKSPEKEHNNSEACPPQADANEYRDFGLFSRRLACAEIELKKNNKKINFSENGSYSAYRPGFFVKSLGKNMLERIIELEQKEGERLKALTNIHILLPDDHIVKNNIGGKRFPLEDKLSYRLSPSYIGLDVLSSYLQIGWMHIPKTNVPNTNAHWEIKGSVNALMNRDVKGANFLELGVGMAWTKDSSIFSSYGFGLNTNKNIESSMYGRPFQLGLDTHLGFFADKLRLVAGHRDLFNRTSADAFTVEVQLNNIEEIIWANTRRCGGSVFSPICNIFR
jgi:predicted acylesterase/phospholipase RssA